MFSLKNNIKFSWEMVSDINAIKKSHNCKPGTISVSSYLCGKKEALFSFSPARNLLIINANVCWKSSVLHLFYLSSFAGLVSSTHWYWANLVYYFNLFNTWEPRFAEEPLLLSFTFGASGNINFRILALRLRPSSWQF